MTKSFHITKRRVKEGAKNDWDHLYMCHFFVGPSVFLIQGYFLLLCSAHWNLIRLFFAANQISFHPLATERSIKSGLCFSIPKYFNRNPADCGRPITSNLMPISYCSKFQGHGCCATSLWLNLNKTWKHIYLFKKQKHCRNTVDCLIKGTLGGFIEYLQTLKGRVCYVEEKVPYYWLRIKDRKYNKHSHVHLQPEQGVLLGKG